MVKEHQSRQQLRKERQGKPYLFVVFFKYILATILVKRVQIYIYINPLLWLHLSRNGDNLRLFIPRKELKKKDASAAATALTHALVDHLNTG